MIRETGQTLQAYTDRHQRVRASWAPGSALPPYCEHIRAGAAKAAHQCAVHPFDGVWCTECFYLGHIHHDQTHAMHACELHPPVRRGNFVPAYTLVRERAAGLGLPDEVHTPSGAIPLWIEGLLGMCQTCDAYWAVTEAQRAAVRGLLTEGLVPQACEHVLDGAAAIVPLTALLFFTCLRCRVRGDAGMRRRRRCERCGTDEVQFAAPTPVAYFVEQPVRRLETSVDGLEAALFTPADDDCFPFTGAVFLAPDPQYCTTCLDGMRSSLLNEPSSGGSDAA